MASYHEIPIAKLAVDAQTHKFADSALHLQTLAPRAGIEPATPPLGGACSIH